MLKKEISTEYARGLIEGSGLFTFTHKQIIDNRGTLIPTFQLKMGVENKELIQGVKDRMGLKNKVYEYSHQGKDGSKRKPYALLIVRDVDGLKNKTIPFLYKKLVGPKADQLEEWLELIGSEKMVPERYKVIYRLHKNGYYKRNIYKD